MSFRNFRGLRAADYAKGSEDSLPKCFNGAKHKRDYMVEIYRLNDNGADPLGREDVIYWCGECGAVVVDEESDGRKYGVISSMRFPRTIEKKFKEKDL